MIVKVVSLDLLLDVMLGLADDPDTREDTVDVFLKYMCGERGGKRGPEEVGYCRMAIGDQYPWMRQITDYPDEVALAQLVALHGKSLLVRPLAGAYHEESEVHIGISMRIAVPMRSTAALIVSFTTSGVPMRKAGWDRPRNDRFNRSFDLNGQQRIVTVSLHSFHKGGDSALAVAIGTEKCVVRVLRESILFQTWLSVDGAFPSLVNPANVLVVLQDLAGHFMS